MDVVIHVGHNVRLAGRYLPKAGQHNRPIKDEVSSMINS